MKVYPLANAYKAHALRDAITDPDSYARKDLNVVAIYTGVKRPPKRGEYYLSGAIPEAHRAPNDLSTPHAIARLVVVRHVQLTQIDSEFTMKLDSVLSQDS